MIQGHANGESYRTPPPTSTQKFKTSLCAAYMGGQNKKIREINKKNNKIYNTKKKKNSFFSPNSKKHFRTKKKNKK